jgi:hypothetical protein
MEKHKGNNHLITSSVYICSIYSIHLHFELYISAGHSDTTLPFPISLYVVVYFNPPYRLKPNQREREAVPFFQHALGMRSDQSASWSCQHRSMDTHLPRMYSLVLCCFSTVLHRPASPPPAGFCRRRCRYAEHTAERGTEAKIGSMDRVAGDAS